MNDLICFSCKQALAKVMLARHPRHQNIWTTQCPACGVVNKLTPTEDPGRFIVSGAIYVVPRPPAINHMAR